MLQKEQWMQIHVLKAQGVSEGARDHAAPGHFSQHGGARYLSAEEVPRYKPREPRPTRLGAFEAYIRRLIRETRMGPFAVIQIDVFADGTPGAD
ncbi:putative integrase [Burkholderia pseudomallei]|nr:putative transposase domain protein [Burkholderia pseudomallei PB08298010]KGS09363.1 putative transposase domain protein [Burkholderia pseudomallei MSHR7504]KGS59292.1 putative transposase domain protein [Burkholderia pseudomallei MSHR5609]KGX64541.1 putative transposase domain protein [Burkholderia pseudomallei TSV44]CAJ3000715.1 putative integrase [Burkholderia pseudomallei]